MKGLKNIFILVLVSVLLITSIPVFAEESNDDIKKDIKQYLQVVDQIDPSLNPIFLNIIKDQIKNKSKDYENKSDKEELGSIRSAVRTSILNYLFYRISILRGTEVFDEKNDKRTPEDKELYQLVSEFKKGDKPYKDTKEIFDLIQGLIREQADLIDKNSSKLILTSNEINQKTKEYYEKTNKIVELIKKTNSSTNRVTFDKLEENKTYLANIMLYHTVNDQKSMSNEAVGEIAKLIKKSDGKVYIQIEMNPIAISMYDTWFSGYLLEMRHIKDFNKSAKDRDNFEKANCLKYYDHTDELCEKYGKDMKYPKILEFPFETKNYEDYWKNRYPNLADSKFKNTIPAKVEVFVPVMEEFTDVDEISNYTGDPDDINAAYKFDFEQDNRYGMGSKYAILNILSDSIEEYKEGDKTAVEKILTKAKAINETNNKEAYKDLQKIINEVESNLDRLIFTKDDESDCISRLNVAMSKCNKTSEENFEVPVILRHSVDDKNSMGNLALVQKAKISKENGKTYMTIKFKALRKKINGFNLIGHLEKLWIYEKNDFNSNAKEVTDVTKVNEVGLDGTTKEYPSLLKFEINPELASKDGEIYVKVFVDAMESISKGMGTQNAKILVKGSQAKAWTDWPKEDPIVDNKGEGNQSGSEEKPSTNINELRGILKDSIDNANALIATNGADRFLSNAMANANSVLLNDKATSTDIRLALSALNNAIARNNPNSSGNSNNSWNKNNNSSWGNNNQGWNNNSSWGSYGNNNQGWNNNSSWGVYNNNQNNNKNNGPVTIQYEVPVEVLHAHENRYSMANGAINHTARVEERNGQFRYSVQFGPMQREFAGKTFTGNLYNLFIYDGSKYQAEQSSGNVWSWVMNGKYDKVRIAVWVDAMDEIAGKGQGGGEQDAILSFNWNNAREVGRVGGNNNNQNQQNQQNQNQQKQAPQVVQN
ncbi:iron transport-associated domain protein, partial [Peptoniphilus sp. DNF00840]